jgi:hypothetical protein
VRLGWRTHSYVWVHATPRGGHKAPPEGAYNAEHTRDDAVALLDLACARRVDTPGRIDAAGTGLLTFELDDLRLTELQVPR